MVGHMKGKSAIRIEDRASGCSGALVHRRVA